SLMRDKKILLVDDDSFVRESMQAAFESLGCDVLTASNGLEGLRLATMESPDVIVLDLIMPKRGGMHVLEKLRKMGSSDTRVIVISACESSRHAEQVMALGADEFLPKPFSMHELVDCVQRCCQCLALV
ncbi:MAG: response regulator, partial [Planctomycetales bacterium]